MQGRKYINLVEIGLVVFEIWRAEFGDFMVPEIMQCIFVIFWPLTHDCVS